MITIIDHLITSVSPIIDAENALGLKFKYSVHMFGSEYAACKIVSKCRDVDINSTLYIMTLKEQMLLCDDTPHMLAYISRITDELSSNIIAVLLTRKLMNFNGMNSLAYDHQFTFYGRLSTVVNVFNEICKNGLHIEFRDLFPDLAAKIERDPFKYANDSRQACVWYAKYCLQ